MRKAWCIVISALMACAAGFSGCSRPALAAKDEYQRFGTQMRWVYDPAEGIDAETLWRSLCDASASVEAAVSASRPESAVSRFNAAAAGETVVADAVSYGIFRTAQAVYAETGGAYNPSVGLLVDLWGFSPRHRAADYAPAYPYDRADFEAELPAAEYVSAFSAAAMTDFSSVGGSASDGVYTLDKPLSAVAEVNGVSYSVRLSLDGIGKGACADAAAELLSAAQLKYGYYNAGGSSLYVLENPSRSDGVWEISVTAPRDAMGASYATLYVKNTTVSTSGDYEQYYEIGGVRYSHIIGRDGIPVGGGSHIVCATVVGGTAAEGDARATALMTMSEAEAKQYASAHADLFRVMFVWYDADRDEYALVTNLEETQYRLTAEFARVEGFA